MKTPHRIRLIYGETTGRYNPETSAVENVETLTETVPCYVNFLSRATVIRDYGEIKERIISCRFNQEQNAFQKAIFNNKLFKPLDSIDTPIKGAVRLKEVLE